MKKNKKRKKKIIKKKKPQKKAKRSFKRAKIRKKSIVWLLNKKGTFEKGSSVFINTKDFIGRPIEKEPNPNEIRSLERGCGLPFLYLPPGVEVTEGFNGIAVLGLILAIGAAAGGGGSSSSGSGSASSN